MNSSLKIACVCFIAAAILILFGLVFGIIDFYKDYQCSTSTDPQWFKEHNCIRYMK